MNLSSKEREMLVTWGCLPRQAVGASTENEYTKEARNARVDMLKYEGLEGEEKEQRKQELKEKYNA